MNLIRDLLGSSVREINVLPQNTWWTRLSKQTLRELSLWPITKLLLTNAKRLKPNTKKLCVSARSF